MKGKIFDIKRFAVHDGDGIRTTVFFKGCPLKCVWCHNPEGISFQPEMQYMERKCISCGLCADICPSKAHRVEDGKHIFDRSKCIKCGKCADVCPGKALIFAYQEWTVQEVADLLLEDKDFYDQSGGGITLSGGECLCQYEFCTAVLKKMKEAGIHCAVDTSGYVPQEAIRCVAPYTDIFLYDVKFWDSEKHKQYIGHSNERILDNLRYIDSLKKDVEVRIPIIPTVNDGEIDEIGKFLSHLQSVKRVRILAYNNLAGSKYERLGMENTMPQAEPPTEEMMCQIECILKKYGLKVIK